MRSILTRREVDQVELFRRERLFEGTAPGDEEGGTSGMGAGSVGRGGRGSAVRGV